MIRCAQSVCVCVMNFRLLWFFGSVVTITFDRAKQQMNTIFTRKIHFLLIFFFTNITLHICILLGYIRIKGSLYYDFVALKKVEVLRFLFFVPLHSIRVFNSFDRLLVFLIVTNNRHWFELKTNQQVKQVNKQQAFSQQCICSRYRK